MTVKELKERLNAYPEESEVYIPCEQYACIPHVVCHADSVTDYIPTETDTDGPKVMIY